MIDETPGSTPSAIAVLGPGGVGGLAAALLAREGNAVTVVAREKTATALRAGGITLDSRKFGTFTADVGAETELRAPVDVVVIATKQTSLTAALERIPPEAVGNALVVPLLNGVEHVELLRERYPNVAPGVIRGAATRTAPGRITHISPFAEIDVASATADCGPLAATLSDAGFTTSVHDDEVAMLWTKLALLAPWALLSSARHVPIGELRTAHRDDLLELVREVADVARAEAGIDTAERAADFYDAFPPESKSSMQVDAEAHLPLETDAIGGAVVRTAARHGIDVPSIRRVLASLT